MRKAKISDAIDDFYEQEYISKKKIRKAKEKYYLKVKKKTLSKSGVPRNYKNNIYEVLVLEQVVVYINVEVYTKVFKEFNEDELLAHYGTDDVTLLLNDNVEISTVYAKNIIDLEITEEVFRKNVFDIAYQVLQAEKIEEKDTREMEDNVGFAFDIKNEFDGMDFSGIK